MRSIDERYRNDPALRNLVDMLESVIRRGEFTPSEIREAAMLAQMNHENTFGRTTLFSPELRKEIEFRCGEIRDLHGRKK